MCYMNCIHEDQNGECIKSPSDLCPDSFNTDQEYWAAIKSRSEEEQDFKLDEYLNQE